MFRKGERVKVTSSPKIVLVLLFSVVGLEVAALLISLRLDSIVHVDLYRYGLIFNSAWAVDYWASYRNFMGCLICSIMFAVVTVVPLYLYRGDRSVLSRWSLILYPIIPASLALVSLYFFYHIDSIVHVTLYQYGLQFSQEWAESYWSIFRATLVLGGAAIVGLIAMSFVTWTDLEVTVDVVADETGD